MVQALTMVRVLLEALPLKLPEEVLANCSAIIGAGLSEVQTHTLVITGDFVGSVRKRVTDPTYAAQYSQDRIGGRTIAKTLQRADGGCDVILDVSVIAHPLLARILAHERGHIVLFERHEAELSPWAAGQSSRCYPDLWRIATIVLEEYRIERYVIPLPFEAIDYWIGVPTNLERGRREIRSALSERLRGGDLQVCLGRVLTVFSGLATSFANLAADVLCEQSSADATKCNGDEVWEYMVGPSWSVLLQSLEGVPPANVPVDTESLHSVVVGVVHALEAWLKHIGFELRPLDNGDFFFAVLGSDS